MKSHGPFTTAELTQSLRESEEAVARFFGSLSSNEFVTSEGQAWSPAQHVDHLNIAVGATARGLSIPPWILGLRFGRARRPSRTFDQLRADYLTLLGGGAGAPGRFVPTFQSGAASPNDVQSSLLGRWGRVNERLRNALGPWSEKRLDHVLLPHPLLGKITARELLYFTIYHGPHHVAAAKRRLPRFAAEGSA